MAFHLAIQNAILAEIARPEFSAALPPLSDAAWLRILNSSNAQAQENDRLEFLGDAIMYASLGHQLYKQLPDGSPGLYTEARSALHSNATFSRLAEKLDILAVSDLVLKALTARTFGEGTSAPKKTKGHIKATADLFETVIGSYYLERGYRALCEWVDELYRPLIVTAKRAYYDNKNMRRAKATKKPAIQVYSPMKPVAIQVKSKPAILRHKLTKKPILAPSVKSSRLSLSQHRAINQWRTSHRSRVAGSSKAPAIEAKPSRVVIDLTALDDSDMDIGYESSGSTANANAQPAATNKRPQGKSARISDDEMQDLADERLLEQMLTPADASPSEDI